MDRWNNVLPVNLLLNLSLRNFVLSNWWTICSWTQLCVWLNFYFNFALSSCSWSLMEFLSFFSLSLSLSLSRSPLRNSITLYAWHAMVVPTVPLNRFHYRWPWSLLWAKNGTKIFSLSRSPLLRWLKTKTNFQLHQLTPPLMKWPTIESSEASLSLSLILRQVTVDHPWS